MKRKCNGIVILLKENKLISNHAPEKPAFHYGKIINNQLNETIPFFLLHFDGYSFVIRNFNN